MSPEANPQFLSIRDIVREAGFEETDASRARFNRFRKMLPVQPQILGGQGNDNRKLLYPRPWADRAIEHLRKKGQEGQITDKIPFSLPDGQIIYLRSRGKKYNTINRSLSILSMLTTARKSEDEDQKFVPYQSFADLFPPLSSERKVSQGIIRIIKKLNTKTLNKTDWTIKSVSGQRRLRKKDTLCFYYLRKEGESKPAFPTALAEKQVFSVSKLQEIKPPIPVSATIFQSPARTIEPDQKAEKKQQPEEEDERRLRLQLTGEVLFYLAWENMDGLSQKIKIDLLSAAKSDQSKICAIIKKHSITKVAKLKPFFTQLFIRTLQELWLKKPKDIQQKPLSFLERDIVKSCQLLKKQGKTSINAVLSDIYQRFSIIVPGNLVSQ